MQRYSNRHTSTMATQDNIQAAAAKAEEAATANKTEITAYRKSTLAWVSMLVTIVAWVVLWFNGYAALGIAVAGTVLGFCGLPHRRPAAKRLAITAIIAALVLIVVVAAYLMVLKIGLGA